MKKTYCAGEYYNFTVTGISNNRIYLKDDQGDTFSVNAFDFQTEWDWASPQVPANLMKCYVKEVYGSGKLVLEQSKDILLMVLYPEAYRGEEKKALFIVESLKTFNDTLFYVVTDAFGLSHMYKPSTQQKLMQPGDEVALIVKGIHEKDNNRSRLVFDEILLPELSSPITALPTSSNEETPTGEFGEESDKVEFKSTIVYPARATGADIDTQMRVILRTIAGFMNAQGGTLYIGVNDNGDAVGIEQDYGMLNSSDKDKYTYQANKDGYENKLRSAMNLHLGPVAQDYVSIKFTEHNDHTICTIEIEPSKSVIWYDERDAFKRMGNRTTHLRSEAIIKLVFDKASMARPEALQFAPKAVLTEGDLLPTEHKQEETLVAMKVEQPTRLKFIGEEAQGHGSFYMNLFSNGDWSWSKVRPTDTDLEFCIPIHSPASKNDLIMVYEDGCVNRVDAYHLHLDKKEGKRYMNGRRGDNVRLVKAFHAKAEDMLACFSTQHGHEFVKVHPIHHVSQHDNMSLKGNRVINTTGMEGITQADIYFVAAANEQRVSALRKTENQLSNSLGFQMDLQKNAKFLQVKDTLENLCDIPA